MAINIRGLDYLKDTLREEASRNGYTDLSSYLRAIINNRNGGVVIASPKTRGLDKGKRYPAKTMLNSDEKKALVECAQAEGVSESFLLLRQIRTLINNEPHFSEGELNALRSATQGVTAIGRNLNQIAKKINSGELESNPLTEKYLITLKEYVKRQADAVNSLIEVNRKRVVEWTKKN